MSFPQFGYPLATQNSLLLSAVNASSAAPSRPSETTPRDAPATSTPNSSAACPCYPPPLLGSYPRLPGGLPEPTPAAAAAATAALYGGAYPPGYLPLGADPAAVMNSMCDLKSQEIGLLPGSPYFPPYDLAGYPYANGFALDPNARRKNATRESTTTLKAWLSEHRKNPYPTKGEKIMLAIITKMTLTQVSTWFANARRRLKKDNKVTWSPRNRGEDDDDDDEMNKEREDDSDIDIENDDDVSPCSRNKDDDLSPNKTASSSSSVAAASGAPQHQGPCGRVPSPTASTGGYAPHPHSAFTPLNPSHQHNRAPSRSPPPPSRAPDQTKDTCAATNNRSTKIWSLAEVASSKQHKGDVTDAPACVTRGPTQGASPPLKAPAGFSAFRPLMHPHHPGAPRPSIAGPGVPVPWGPHGAAHAHPAYSYALSQHYLHAMTMARAPFLPHHQDPKSDLRKSPGSPLSSRSSSPACSPSLSPVRPPAHSKPPSE